MNLKSVSSLEQFKLDLVKLEQEQLLMLIEKHQNLIKVSNKTALKKLPLLFETVLNLGNSKGFSATSLRDISQATDMSLGAIYTYTSSKEDLLLMVNAYHIAIIENCYEAFGKPYDSPFDNLLLSIKIHLYLSQIYRPWFYFAFTETKHLSKKNIRQSKASELKSEQFFHDIIESGIHDKSFREHSSDFSAAMVKSLLQDWYLKPWKYSNRGISLEDYNLEIKRLLTLYLLP